jgi:hypothetical protein
VAFKTFADAATLPAADLNTYLMGQALVKATSSTRPSSPTEGSAVYETDTDKLMIYTTATTGWQPPWNLPWGYITSASSTTAQTGITTVTDMNGSTVTWTPVAGRRYKVTMNGVVYGDTVDDYVNVQMLDTSAAIARLFTSVITTSNAAMNWHLETIVSGLSGAQTWKARLLRNSGSGTMATYMSGGAATAAYVEDIGPSGAPS